MHSIRMAQIVPDVLPRSASVGARQLQVLLRRLPEDCVVYYEPLAGNRCPDFVVVCLDLGLLIIEVKGWRIGDILTADPHTVQVTTTDAPSARSTRTCSLAEGTRQIEEFAVFVL